MPDVATGALTRHTPSASLGVVSGASGSMTVDQGASVNADVFGVGVATGTSATMNVSGSGTTVNLTGDPDGIRGAGFSVGAAGSGIMDVTTGAVITVDGTTTPQGSGFSVGGSRTSPSGGTGTLNVDGAGTLIRILGSQDVNGDGRADLVCHIVTSELPVTGDSAVILDAMTFSGTSGHGIPIRGIDSIKIVP